jgi:hypothetical protein
LLLVLPSAESDCREILMIIRGRPWAQIRANRNSGPELLAKRLEQVWERACSRPFGSVDYDTIDEVNILNRWLFRYAGHPAMLPLGDEPNWPVLAVQALSLDDLALEFNGRESNQDVDEVFAEASPGGELD